MSTASDIDQSSFSSSDTLRDVFLWRRKKLSFLVLSAATGAWVLLNVYEFNFVTVLCWAAMLIVASLFLYGNLVRLLRKEDLDFTGVEISEETTSRVANSVRGSIEDGIRWIFEVSAAREWFVFVRVVAVLWLLSYLGSCFDLLTLLYIGIMVGLTVPLIYVKNEERIKRWEQRVRMQLRRFYDKVDEKVFKKIKNKVVQVHGRREEKEKKVE
ncbi:hypothetical protein Tsubulata_030304 [Turnera subulata]|uniref:Reticulon-like protein n=1 Tax=Turnera subulata TaxID=218843 RepID=A0A9Q0GIK2_9ROSI|nr:hypothetical protein Tsubulata_030304 [Turnera subulata]